MSRAARLIITLCVAAVFYVAAISREIYIIASPPDLASHTVLRKTESLIAFVLVGLLTAWTIGRRRDLPAILGLSLAAYSALIELGQRLTGTHESLRMSAFDVTCGAVGGIVAAWIAMRGFSKLSQ